VDFDVVVVGSGIVGLACAWAAWQRGDRVLVLERHDRCVGASIRNFGFVTVTGQGRGQTWSRARVTRDVWADIAPKAGIEVVQEGLLVLPQREEAAAILQSLRRQTEGDGLEWIEREALVERHPQLTKSPVLGALYSPHELRIESRVAIAQLQAWLQSQGVVFQNGAAAHLSHDGRLSTLGDVVRYGHLVLAPGADLRHFAPHLVAKYQLTTCRLTMLRVQPPAGYVLPHPVMSDLSLVRYRGYAEQEGRQALLARLQSEQPDHLAHGIHLIVVQSADGSLVVGDSHHYADTIGPFAQSQTEALILQEMQAVLQLAEFRVSERWVGEYPSGTQDAVIERITQDISLVSVTSGTGMSTGFALAQEWAEMKQ
jgi:D-hydroxyproline dehydrogenase subunit beta